MISVDYLLFPNHIIKKIYTKSKSKIGTANGRATIFSYFWIYKPQKLLNVFLFKNNFLKLMCGCWTRGSQITLHLTKIVVIFPCICESFSVFIAWYKLHYWPGQWSFLFEIHDLIYQIGFFDQHIPCF